MNAMGYSPYNDPNLQQNMYPNLGPMADEQPLHAGNFNQGK